MEKVKYVLFPGTEAQLGEGRHQDYSFEQWAACFILHMMAMAGKFPEAIPTVALKVALREHSLANVVPRRPSRTFPHERSLPRRPSQTFSSDCRGF